MAGRPKWYAALWSTIDGFLRGLSDGMRKIVRALRWLRAFLVLAIIVVLGGAGLSIWRPEWLPYAYAAGAVFLVIPLIILLVLVALPLKAKSVVRLVDMGYPRNARELAVRLVARKLHEQSIETEELIMETAWNESRKMLKRYRERAKRLQEELDERDRQAADNAAAKARRERDEE